jgi:hypothetical protein
MKKAFRVRDGSEQDRGGTDYRDLMQIITE